MKFIFTFIITLLFCPLMSNAQVTIGADEAPLKGALLQLKETLGATKGAKNSTKGLLLPRVILTDLYSLSGITTDSGDTVDDYVGLMVYNLPDMTVCDYISAGVYVWSGSVWKSYTGNGIVKRDYRKEDLEALQKILNDNSSNTLGWTIDTENVDNPNNYLLNNVTWSGTGCGRRVTGLDCSSSSLTKLDVSTLSALESLNCSGNSLSALDVTKNTVLTNLYCYDNLLTTDAVKVCQSVWDNWSSSTSDINPIKSSDVYNKIACN